MRLAAIGGAAVGAGVGDGVALGPGAGEAVGLPGEELLAGLALAPGEALGGVEAPVDGVAVGVTKVTEALGTGVAVGLTTNGGGPPDEPLHAARANADAATIDAENRLISKTVYSPAAMPEGRSYSHRRPHELG